MLPLTFADAADYDRITGNDKLSILGLAGLAPGSQLTVRVTPGAGGDPFEIKVITPFARLGFWRGGPHARIFLGGCRICG